MIMWLMGFTAISVVVFLMNLFQVIDLWLALTAISILGAIMIYVFLKYGEND